MSGNMNRIPQKKLDKWKREAIAGNPWIENACIEDERILALIAEVEDLRKTLAGFGEEG